MRNLYPEKVPLPLLSSVIVKTEHFSESLLLVWIVNKPTRSQGSSSRCSCVAFCTLIVEVRCDNLFVRAMRLATAVCHCKGAWAGFGIPWGLASIVHSPNGHSKDTGDVAITVAVVVMVPSVPCCPHENRTKAISAFPNAWWESELEQSWTSNQLITNLLSRSNWLSKTCGFCFHFMQHCTCWNPVKLNQLFYSFLLSSGANLVI